MPGRPNLPFRRTCHPLLLAAVALACDPVRAAPIPALNLVPPPLSLQLILPPPYALESGVVTDILTLWRSGGWWEPGMNVLAREPQAIPGRNFATPEPATAQPAWTRRDSRCNAPDGGQADDTVEVDGRP